jgi:glycosyltransferase involved in cell wall biosynthesis
LELIDFYRGALFGVMPSFLEGWGLGASECLDFGVPVIISTAPALREATRGIMPSLDPNDEGAWFGQIRKLAEDTNYRASLQKAISQSYRPISTSDSWKTIKNSLWDGAHEGN